MTFRGIAAAMCTGAAAVLLAGCSTAEFEQGQEARGASADTMSAFQIVSAGYTGCKPADNVISNASLAWGGMWQATCKGKTYRCTSDSAVGGRSFACAPLVE